MNLKELLKEIIKSVGGVLKKFPKSAKRILKRYKKGVKGVIKKVSKSVNDHVLISHCKIIIILIC